MNEMKAQQDIKAVALEKCTSIRIKSGKRKNLKSISELLGFSLIFQKRIYGFTTSKISKG